MGERDIDRSETGSSSQRGPLDWEPRRVDVSRIESELAQFWRSAGEGADQAVTRACALNLVVHVDRQEAADRASETIAHVAVHDPNRAIVVISEPAAEIGLDAWISARCFLPSPNSPQVCCEQITISARGGADERALGLVLPLLVGDLPVVLWWIGDPPLESGTFDRYAGVADRVILDSIDFADPCAKMPLLARRVATADRGPAVSDLNWARVTSWRELTAQFFDTPEMTGYLGEIQSVRVEYSAPADGPANPAQAALLVGWLGSRLGWRGMAGALAPLDCEESRFLSAGGWEIATELVPAARADVEAGSVVGLAIRTQGRHAATFTIAVEPGADRAEATAKIAGRPPIGRTVCPTPLTMHHLICQELEFVGRDETYEEALAFIAGQPAPSAEARRAS